MEPSEDRIDVSLPHGRSYPIVISSGCLLRVGDLLMQQGMEGEAFVLSDEAVWKVYGDTLRECLQGAGYSLLETYLARPGEESKSLATWKGVLDRLVALEDGAVRRIFLINLGGGVIGDLGGFVAAAYRRGIPFVQVPTTLMAQVDSSVGGKTGVNHPGGKNLIGAYHQPDMVIIDPKTLETLPGREVRAGLAEVIKYGLIWDASFFSYMEANKASVLSLGEDALRFIVKRSCEIKADIVAQDEKEQKGVRTLLNFGHTFGHALEAATDYRKYLHGEAVGIGMLCAARLSVSLGSLSEGDYERTEVLLNGVGLETRVRGVDFARVWEAMKRDKKFIHGRNRFVLLERIGGACVVEGVDDMLVTQALDAHVQS